MQKPIKKLKPYLIQIAENTHIITSPTGNTIAKLTINDDNTITIEDYTSKLNDLEYALNQQHLQQARIIIEEYAHQMAIKAYSVTANSYVNNRKKPVRLSDLFKRY